MLGVCRRPCISMHTSWDTIGDSGPLAEFVWRLERWLTPLCVVSSRGVIKVWHLIWIHQYQAGRRLLFFPRVLRFAAVLLGKGSFTGIEPFSLKSLISDCDYWKISIPLSVSVSSRAEVAFKKRLFSGSRLQLASSPTALIWTRGALKLHYALFSHSSGFHIELKITKTIRSCYRQPSVAKSVRNRRKDKRNLLDDTEVPTGALTGSR